MPDYIEVRGARQHNLKNINLKIPKNLDFELAATLRDTIHKLKPLP